MKTLAERVPVGRERDFAFLHVYLEVPSRSELFAKCSEPSSCAACHLLAKIEDMVSRKLSETFARSATTKKRSYYWDTVLPGFGLRVSPPPRGRGGCRRTWMYRYRTAVGERQREFKLGSHPIMGFPAARVRVLGLMSEVAAGRDPSRQRHEARRAMSIRDLCAAFVEVRIPTMSKKGAKPYLSMIKNHILNPSYGLPRVALAELDTADIQGLVDAVASQLNGKGIRKLAQAKKVKDLMRTLYNFSIDQGYREPSTRCPLRGVRLDRRRKDWELPKIEPIGHIFEGGEPHATWIALQEVPIHPAASDALKLIALTGVRSDEARELRWRDVKLEARYPHLQVRRHKTDKRVPIKEVPLSSSAREVLRRWGPRGPEEFVFPSPVDDSKPVGDLWTPWTRVRKAAKVPRARVHDLRGLAACHLVEAGWSETQIMAFMAWESRDMVRRYVSASRSMRRDGADILDLSLRRLARSSE